MTRKIRRNFKVPRKIFVMGQRAPMGSGIGGTCADLGRGRRNEKPGDLPAITKPTAAGLGKEKKADCPSQDIRHVAAGTHGSGIGGTCADLGRGRRNEKPGDLPVITKPTATGLAKDLEGVSFKPEVTKQKRLAMAMMMARGRARCGSVRRRSYGGASRNTFFLSSCCLKGQLAMEQQHLEVVEKPLKKEEHTSRQRSNIATIIARLSVLEASRTRYASALLTFTVLVLILTFRLPRGPAPLLSSSFPTAALQFSPSLPPFDSSPSFSKLPLGSGVAQLRTGHVMITGHGPTASSPVQRVQFFLRIKHRRLGTKVHLLMAGNIDGSRSQDIAKAPRSDSDRRGRKSSRARTFVVIVRMPVSRLVTYRRVSSPTTTCINSSCWVRSLLAVPCQVSDDRIQSGYRPHARVATDELQEGIPPPTTTCINSSCWYRAKSLMSEFRDSDLVEPTAPSRGWQQHQQQRSRCAQQRPATRRTVEGETRYEVGVSSAIIQFSLTNVIIVGMSVPSLPTSRRESSPQQPAYVQAARQKNMLIVPSQVTHGRFKTYRLLVTNRAVSQLAMSMATTVKRHPTTPRDEAALMQLGPPSEGILFVFRPILATLETHTDFK
ncbi:hypothetical protein C8R46DRAFT_1030703 [Mycena filopes]|nr:hypothetical protein C8R46DRAFT_1030703 [Mycena filopes]